MTTVEELHAKHGEVADLRPDVAKDELHELALFLQDHGWAGVMCLREAVETLGELDLAWAEAEAALPEGSALEVLGGEVVDRYAATVRGDHWLPVRSAGGPTPAAALRALTAKLREVGR